MKHVIIGVGPAGVAAAKTIRRLRPQDEITMVSSDSAVHSRCMLHHVISGARSEESLCFVPGEFFAENNIGWLKSAQVTGVDTERRLVVMGDVTLPYDSLLIATGSNSVIPPVGALRTAKNVYGLRHLSDAVAIRTAAQNATDVVVVGSGLVGLDAAYALLELGKRVTIVEMAPRILPLQLDEHGGAQYQRLFEEHGAVFKLARRAEDTLLDESGNVKALVLDGGEEIPCDFVVVAAGVRPATALLDGSGIQLGEAGRTVVVNNAMHTSDPHVWAAGDVTGLAGIWPNATKMGEVAGANMAVAGGADESDAAVYDDTYAIKNTINFFGLQTLAVGDTIPAEGDTVLAREDRSRYQRVILRDGAVAGVILMGDISNSGFWQYLIKNRIPVEGMGKNIFKLSYADFFATSPAGEYQYKL